MGDAGKDIKSIAIQMEKDGIKFYNDLANTTFHPMGKMMFKSFVEDEKLHAKRLRALLSAPKEKSQKKEKDTVNPRERLVTIFQEMGEELKKKVDANTNDIEAVRLAMELEKKGIEFYDMATREASDPRDSETYRFLAGEERVHFGILKNTLDFLEKAELWAAESEGRIYDLWMTMVNKKA